MCLKETYSEARTGRYASDAFHIKNDFKLRKIVIAFIPCFVEKGPAADATDAPQP
jgi:hypothetical protein